MTTGSALKFEPIEARQARRGLSRLNAFVAANRDLTLSSASNRLVDEALRMHEHPLIAFKVAPAGQRARVVGGPDVWEIVGAKAFFSQLAEALEAAATSHETARHGGVVWLRPV